MSINIGLATPEDQRRCSELLDVLAKAIGVWHLSN